MPLSLTVIVRVVSDVLHKYPVAREAVSFTLSPIHRFNGPLAVMVGARKLLSDTIAGIDTPAHNPGVVTV